MSARMDNYMPDENSEEMQKVPSLLNLCIQKAIDNVRYLGDVGGTAEQLLRQILPHCTCEQLRHIEDSTEGRDLSPMTDCLWKNFYKKEFGERSFNLAVNNMRSKKVTFKWRHLYEAKLKDVEQAEEKLSERLRQRYQNEDAQKRSRQVKLCTKVPPTSHKRNCYGGWGPGSIIGNSKSTLMKKAKVEFLNSPEVKNLTALKRNVVQKTDRSVCIRRPGSFSSKSSSSTSNASKTFQRR